MRTNTEFLLLRPLFKKYIQFLKKKTKGKITHIPQRQTEERGISSKKKNAILKDLGPLIASSRRRAFFEELHLNDESIDLVDSREE